MRTETRRVRGDGLDLHVQVTGIGPPVILLHGFPGSGHSWRKQVGSLADASYAPWVTNLRGYPPSDVCGRARPTTTCAASPPMSPPSSRPAATRAHVFGHDWGGLIA
ncbi:MAG: alpha/beta hydrolase [Burkholderia sp.]|nr:alpha/beta hydrolase [Burkholderia sp.]